MDVQIEEENQIILFLRIHTVEEHLSPKSEQAENFSEPPRCRTVEMRSEVLIP